jgi:hypothetical protein
LLARRQEIDVESDATAEETMAAMTRVILAEEMTP